MKIVKIELNKRISNLKSKLNLKKVKNAFNIIGENYHEIYPIYERHDSLGKGVIGKLGTTFNNYYSKNPPPDEIPQH